mmetsp:Transcript_96509/g.278555  ORF Transcript_96509/g.278555 Transcript_96509/m.278555 type:complete len:264 (-) Transcript_96509:274-1065(-)
MKSTECAMSKAIPMGGSAWLRRITTHGTTKHKEQLRKCMARVTMPGSTLALAKRSMLKAAMTKAGWATQQARQLPCAGLADTKPMCRKVSSRTPYFIKLSAMSLRCNTTNTVTIKLRIPTTLQSGMPRSSSDVNTDALAFVCTQRSGDRVLIETGGGPAETSDTRRFMLISSFPSNASASRVAISKASTQASASSSDAVPKRRLVIGPAPGGRCNWKQCRGTPSFALMPSTSRAISRPRVRRTTARKAPWRTPSPRPRPGLSS